MESGDAARGGWVYEARDVMAGGEGEGEADGGVWRPRLRFDSEQA